MHIRLIAVGDRQPGWVDDAVKIYTARFPREWQFKIEQVATARRSKKNKSEQAMEAESAQILSRIRKTEQVILLDERGKQMTSQQLAGKLGDWQSDGRDLCFVIGGPDGVAPSCRERADSSWSLSQLTLPHGLARVLFAEQMYRAWALQTGHPYHRD